MSDAAVSQAEVGTLPARGRVGGVEYVVLGSGDPVTV
ncbi:MAG: hypothetical protein QOG60_512, partial [Frankiaceae bacterium]|nr:hypothetical protein [Frankiaceae bacterium]